MLYNSARVELTTALQPRCWSREKRKTDHRKSKKAFPTQNRKRFRMLSARGAKHTSLLILSTLEVCLEEVSYRKYYLEHMFRRCFYARKAGRKDLGGR